MVRIEAMKDKWGCCTSAGEITLAEDLVEMDERFQDYVIVHELLLVRLPTHNQRFKALMTASSPSGARWMLSCVRRERPWIKGFVSDLRVAGRS